jgi:precorrin isomerase
MVRGRASLTSMSAAMRASFEPLSNMTRSAAPLLLAGRAWSCCAVLGVAPGAAMSAARMCAMWSSAPLAIPAMPVGPCDERDTLDADGVARRSVEAPAHTSTGRPSVNRRDMKTSEHVKDPGNGNVAGVFHA